MLTQYFCYIIIQQPPSLGNPEPGTALLAPTHAPPLAADDDASSSLLAVSDSSIALSH